jgi:WD repeat-containing protein 44
VLGLLRRCIAAGADVREKRKRKSDVPVTGLDVLPQRPGSLLVSTRDSRVRLFQGTTQQIMKYKGHRNKATSMISATFSQDGLFVISGSDDGSAPLDHSQPDLQ